MRDRRPPSHGHILTLLIAVLLTACAAETPETAEPRDQPAAEEEEGILVEYLFVQHADSVTLNDGLLTLEGISNDVLYFSDRPHRIFGRESVEAFLGAWDEGEESFAAIPPNAVVTVKKEDELVDVVVVLRGHTLTDRTLVYTVEVLDGPESGTGDHAAIFIDAFGDLLRGGLRKEADRAAGLRDGLRGGDRGSAGRGGDRNLPRDPSFGGRRGGGEPRNVNRRGSRRGPEIR